MARYERTPAERFWATANGDASRVAPPVGLTSFGAMGFDPGFDLTTRAADRTALFSPQGLQAVGEAVRAELERLLGAAPAEVNGRSVQLALAAAARRGGSDAEVRDEATQALVRAIAQDTQAHEYFLADLDPLTSVAGQHLRDGEIPPHPVMIQSRKRQLGTNKVWL